MSKATKAAPTIGPWQDNCDDGSPYGTDNVLGFYLQDDDGARRVRTQVVYCILHGAGDKVDFEEWFGTDNQEVDPPDAWAEIIYPKRKNR